MSTFFSAGITPDDRPHYVVAEALCELLHAEIEKGNAPCDTMGRLVKVMARYMMECGFISEDLVKAINQEM